MSEGRLAPCPLGILSSDPATRLVELSNRTPSARWRASPHHRLGVPAHDAVVSLAAPGSIVACFPDLVSSSVWRREGLLRSSAELHSWLVEVTSCGTARTIATQPSHLHRTKGNVGISLRWRNRYRPSYQPNQYGFASPSHHAVSCCTAGASLRARMSLGTGRGLRIPSRGETGQGSRLHSRSLH